MGRSVTPTVEGGLLIAITIILGIISISIPIIGMLAEFFCAIPLAILSTRQGIGKSLTALFVTFILLSILISPLPALRLVLSFGLCGVIFGWCLRKKFSAVRIFFTILAFSSAAQVLILGFIIVVLDVNLIETQIQMLRESFNESFALYESMGVEASKIDEARTQVKPILEILASIIPSLLIVTALINSVAIWFTAHWIFPKLQIKIPTLPPFANWRLPSLFFYTAIIGGLSMYWGITRGWTEILEISLNLTIISLLIGLIEGFSLLSAIFDHYKVSKFVRMLLYAILILNLFLLQLVAITGLIDMIFDYRKRFFEN